jgi:hypothetical protein
MIHQNHMPLDQRRDQAIEMCHGRRFTLYYGLPLMPAIISGDPKHVGSPIGDPRDAEHSCIALHDPRWP